MNIVVIFPVEYRSNTPEGIIILHNHSYPFWDGVVYYTYINNHKMNIPVIFPVEYQ